jgi:sugar O-acyltransferase (sialic acid O-acetyltransferase NeuD family)
MSSQEGKSVVIFGTGDFARIAAVYLREDSPHTVVAFTVNKEYIQGSSLLGIDVVPFESIAESHPPDSHAMFVAVGFKRVNKARAEVYEQCKAMGYGCISYVSSRASHVGEFTVGDNCFIFEENVIQPFVTIGNNVVLWSGNHVGHDATIEDHCFIASHAVISGHARIGAYSFVGVNATFRDGVTVGPENVIGAGALILKDTKPQAVHAARHTDALKMLSPDLKSFQ